MYSKIGDRILYRKDKNNNLIILISGKIEKWQETLILCWLVAWTFCGGYIIYEIFSGNLPKEQKLILFIYLVFWGYFEVKIARVWAWRKWGKEMIKIDDTSIQVKNDIKGYGKLNTYFIENLKDFKLIEIPSKSFSSSYFNAFWMISKRSFSFEYLGITKKIGIQLNEQDAKKLYDLIKNRIRTKA